jgi:site-specific DNA recombinase
MSAKAALRFAALIRVSTEKQEKQGESLRTQKTQLTEAVKGLGAEVVIWYGGQEHATAGWEKSEVDRLLQDAAKRHKPFDAVVVADESRWSRDNLSSEIGLEKLLANKIRFFTKSQEYDLHDPGARLWLGMSSTIGAYQARTQTQKSMLNRIHRAKRGIPVCGKLPFGRTYDKATGKWGIDATAQKMVKDVAKRYLAGERLPDLADEYDVNRSNLHKILTKRCGPIWEQHFGSDELNIHEVVPTPVPPLLPEETIKAILKTAAGNKTFKHGHIKHRYLFARMVFCRHCGYAMSGQINDKGVRYYRHVTQEGNKKAHCPLGYVPADHLEAVVMRHLYECFGNPKAVKEAIEAATPNMDRINAARERRAHVEKTMASTQAGRDKILRLLADGKITDDEANRVLADSEKKLARSQEELGRLDDSLHNVPSPEVIKVTADQVATVFRKHRIDGAKVKLNAKIIHANHAFDEMSWEEKRHLVELVFSGTTSDGKRMGIYISAIDGEGGRQYKRGKKQRYTIRGHLIQDEGWFPLSERQLDTYFTFGAPSKQTGLTNMVSESATLRRRLDLPRPARGANRRSASDDLRAIARNRRRAAGRRGPTSRHRPHRHTWPPPHA